MDINKEPEYKYPIYKTHGNGKTKMYLKFTTLMDVECIARESSSAAWGVGHKTDDCYAHTDSVWKDWCGPKPVKTYNIKDFT